ncbi:hypothetical protein [Nocardia sp. NPDC049707]|uniref:hypothetical protein n=1 Tax=Nocardia sp. NPDC049707 TaxID=3154735 RepID=UPI003444C94A
MSRFDRRHSLAAIEPTPHAADPAGEYRPDLDRLRRLAIALVVVFHIWMSRAGGDRRFPRARRQRAPHVPVGVYWQGFSVRPRY